METGTRAKNKTSLGRDEIPGNLEWETPRNRGFSQLTKPDHQESGAAPRLGFPDHHEKGSRSDQAQATGLSQPGSRTPRNQETKCQDSASRIPGTPRKWVKCFQGSGSGERETRVRKPNRPGERQSGRESEPEPQGNRESLMSMGENESKEIMSVGVIELWKRQRDGRGRIDGKRYGNGESGENRGREKRERDGDGETGT